MHRGPKSFGGSLYKIPILYAGASYNKVLQGDPLQWTMDKYFVFETYETRLQSKLVVPE